MLESVLTVRWLDGDRVETVWRSRGDPDPGDRRFHSSSKQRTKQVHGQRPQIRQIWMAGPGDISQADNFQAAGAVEDDLRVDGAPASATSRPACPLAPVADMIQVPAGMAA